MQKLMHRKTPPAVSVLLESLVGVVTFCLLSGCSNSMPQTVTVRGKVTYQGKPVPNGLVTFLPTEVAEGLPIRPATGDLQPDGSFAMKTFRVGDGVVPGEYAVTIVSYRNWDWLNNPDEKPEYNIPEKYILPQTSGLTAFIPADAAETVQLDFHLVD